MSENDKQHLAETILPDYPEEQCRLGKYEHLELLAEGGFSRIYKAHDPGLGRQVAIKVLNRELLASRKIKEQFFAEIKTLARLNIPNTVRLFDCGEEDEHLYYAMELVNGVSLENYCVQHRPDLRERLRIIETVARAVVRLHKAGIIHRDIKPRNVMIDEHGEVKLVDFGLATHINRESTTRETASTFSGSPGYMPPELFVAAGAASITAAADVYALGVLAYETLSGTLPYDIEFLSPEEIFAVISSEPPGKLKLFTGARPDARLEKIIMRSLDPDPRKRPTAKEFALAIGQSLNGGRSGWKTVCPAILVLLLAGCMVYYLLREIQQQTQPAIGTAPPATQDAGTPTATAAAVANDIIPPAALPVQTRTSQNEIPQQTLYRNAAPDELLAEWKNVKNELAGNFGMKNNGALLYELPSKCHLIIRHHNIVMLEADADFQRKGVFYQSEGRDLVLEFRKERWDEPETFRWKPVAGNVDVFRPAHQP